PADRLHHQAVGIVAGGVDRPVLIQAGWAAVGARAAGAAAFHGLRAVGGEPVAVADGLDRGDGVVPDVARVGAQRAADLAAAANRLRQHAIAVAAVGVDEPAVVDDDFGAVAARAAGHADADIDRHAAVHLARYLAVHAQVDPGALPGAAAAAHALRHDAARARTVGGDLHAAVGGDDDVAAIAARAALPADGDHRADADRGAGLEIERIGVGRAAVAAAAADRLRQHAVGIIPAGLHHRLADAVPVAQADAHHIAVAAGAAVVAAIVALAAHRDFILDVDAFQAEHGGHRKSMRGTAVAAAAADRLRQ